MNLGKLRKKVNELERELLRADRVVERKEDEKGEDYEGGLRSSIGSGQGGNCIIRSTGESNESRIKQWQFTWQTIPLSFVISLSADQISTFSINDEKQLCHHCQGIMQHLPSPPIIINKTRSARLERDTSPRNS